MTGKTRRALSILLALLMLLQALPALAEEAGEWNEAVSDVVQGSWYTLAFVASGETVQSIAVLAGTALDSLPEAPTVEGARFEGWYIGDERIEAGFVPQNSTTVTAVYRSNANAVQSLYSETAIGSVTYFSMGAPSLPEGASATAAFIENASIADKALAAVNVPEGMAARVLGILGLGVSDLYWTLEGSLRVTVSLKTPIELHPEEQLYVYDARALDQENPQPTNARFMQGYDTIEGITLPAAQFGAYALIGVYTPSQEPAQHTVTFLDVEGNAFEARTLNKGDALGELVNAPDREGYSFVAWQDQDGRTVSSETVVEHDLVLAPVYLELYPATTADAQSGSVTVHVEVPQGALPQSARFRMLAVDAEGVRGKVEKAIGQEASGIIAVDMAFVDENDQEIHPLKPVTVSVSLGGLADAKRISVVHIKDDGNTEIVYSGEPETVKTRGEGDRKEFSFTTESFSVYAVAPVGDSGENARMTIRFYNTSRANTEGGRDPLLASMIVKNSDSAEALETLIYDPGAGAVAEGEMFKGWLVVENPTGDPADYVYTAADAQNARDIEQVRAWAESKQITEGEIVNIYALIYKTYEVRFVDEDMTTIHSEAMIFLESEDSGTYTITVSYTPKSQDAEFQGWRPTQATSANVTAPGQPPYQVGTTVTFSGNVVFMPEVPYGYWLSFAENGKGASYTAPQFVKRGNTTVEPAAPQRFGYSFGGWYTDQACTQAFTFGRELTQHTTLYAKWTPNATANYTVIIWKQNVDGTGYDFAESITLSGPVESDVNSINPHGSGENAYATISSYVPYTGTSGSSYYVLENGQYVLRTVYYNNGTWYRTRTYSWGVYTYSNPVDAVYTFSSSNYNYPGFALSDYDDPVTINPEGTAVVNVYFDRNEYTLTFEIYDYIYTVSTGDNDNIPNKYGDVGGQKARIYWRNGAFRTTDRNNGPIYNGTVYTRSNSQSWHAIKQITALYGQNISSHFPIVGTNGVTYNNGERWDPQSNTPYSEVLVYIDIMPAADVTFRLDEKVRPLKTMNYYIEALPGTANTVTAPNTLYEVTNNNPVSANGKQFILYNSISARYNGVTPDEDYIDLDGFTKIGADSRWSSSGGTKYYIYDERNNGTINFYYSRDSYKILFQDGVYQNGNGVPIDEANQGNLKISRDILYQADISSYNKGGADYYTPQRAGYVFEGWYLDDACTQPYTFTTMPKGGVIVFAKWRQIQYRVFLHPNDYNPDGSIDESLVWGDANQQTNFRVSIGEKIANGQQIDALRDEYELIGWYMDAVLKKPFNFNAYVLNEQTVTRAYNKQTDYTDPYNQYGVLTGPGSNSDLTRFWITKKLDLYAKWRAKIEGAQGINVRFVSMEGTFEGGDTVRFDPLTYYLDRAEATAYSAPIPNDEKKQFLHWVVQTWNGSEFVDTNVHVFAGDTFEVLKQNAQRTELAGHTEQNPKYQYIVQLRAEYGDREEKTPTHIHWFKNDGVETSALRSDLHLHINEAVSIVPAQTRPGYTFLGWARIQEAEGEDGTLRPNYPVTAADVYLKYENGTFYEMDSSIAGTQAVTQVAADEAEPYHAMYAVWEPAPYDVTVSKTFAGIEADEIPSAYQIAYQDQYAQHKTQGILKLTDEDVSVSADRLSYTWVIEDVPYESILSLTESAYQNDYFTVAASAAVAGGQAQTLTETDGSFSIDLTIDLDTSKNTASFTNTYTRTKADVSVTKTFEGIEASDIPAAFAITNDYNSVVFTKENGSASADGLVYTWTLEKIPLGQNVVFTESGYTLQGYAVYASPAPQAEVTVAADGQNAASFTNVYAERKDISVTKTFTGLTQTDLDALKSGFKIVYSVNGSVLGELRLTDPDVTVNGTTYTWTVKDAGVGLEYAFAEEGYTHPEYDVSVSATGNPLVVSRAGSNQVSITNAYTHKTAPLTISKTVTVPEGFTLDANKSFAFTITVSDTPALTGSFGGVTLTNGQGSFSLKHGQSVTLTGLPVGAAYSIAEAVAQGYTPDAPVKSGAIQEGENLVAFTNSYQASSVSAQIPVTKVLSVQSGTAPDITEQYTFTIAPVDGAVMPSTVTVKNPDATGGTVSYPAVTYTQPGTYQYSITESGDVPGVVNDSAAANGKTAVVTVTDDGQGQLHAAVTGVTFTNSYSEVSVSVTKAWADGSDKYGLRPENLALTLKRQNDPVDLLPTVTKNGDAWVYTWTGLPEKNSAGQTYEYSVSEDSVPSGYSASGSPAINGGTITNTLDAGSLTVTKTVSIDPENAADGKTYSFTVTTVANGKTLYVQSNATLSESAYSFTGLTPDSPISIEGLPAGIYTVTEQGTEEGGAAQIETYSLSTSGGGQVTVEKGKTASAQLVNAYTRNTASLSVSKTVDGNMGNRETPFAFTVTLESALPSDYAAPEGVSLNAGRTVLSFSLKHGQSVTLPDLPIGAMLTILETNGSGYSTSHSVPGGEDTAPEDSQQARTCAFTLPAEGAAISYTNSLNVVIPTGIALDRLPYLVLITLGVLMFALLAPLKRRKRED